MIPLQGILRFKWGVRNHDDIASVDPASINRTPNLKDEQRLDRERNKDIKLFLRKEQAILRKEQAERQRRFLEELKLDKQIEKFRVREVKELEKLEKIS